VGPLAGGPGVVAVPVLAALAGRAGRTALAALVRLAAVLRAGAVPPGAVHGGARTRHGPGAGGRRVGARGGGGGDRYRRRHIAVTRRGERAVGTGQHGVDAALGKLHEGRRTVVVVALRQRVPAAAAAGRALAVPVSVLVVGHD